jgi:uncharacterized protein YjeT (DUF2065 family)
LTQLTTTFGRRIFRGMKRTLILAAGFVLVLAGAGCSSFNGEWRKAQNMAVTHGDIAGRWEGTWKSEKNGHHGALRCIISPASETNHYEARFDAKYASILSFSYSVDLQTTRQGDIFQFTGSADLGKVGGVYNYQGQADKSRFLSNYTSKDDHGTFEMLKLLSP